MTSLLDLVEDFLSCRQCESCGAYQGEIGECPVCVRRCECGNCMDKGESVCDLCKLYLESESHARYQRARVAGWED